MNETLSVAGLGSLARTLCMRNCLRDTAHSNTSAGGHGFWRGCLNELSCHPVSPDMRNPRRFGGYLAAQGFSVQEVGFKSFEGHVDLLWGHGCPTMGVLLQPEDCLQAKVLVLGTPTN